jgi:hypothetical protein
MGGLLAPAALLACSGIVVVKDGKILLGGNNDTSYSTQLKLRVVPSHDDLFGRVCVSMDVVPAWTPVGLDCMNDRGLAMVHANVPAAPTPYDPDKPQFRHNFLEKIVSECANVKQAVAMIQAYSLPAEHNAFIHIMMVDASGDSAVVEWVDGGVKVIRRDGNAQFMTNHLLSKPETAGGPKSRYARGSLLVPTLEATPPGVVALLKEVSQGAIWKGNEVGTLHSNIWDVKDRKLYLYYKRDFDHPLVFSLDEELGKGAHTLELKDLFPNPSPFETQWRDENGPVPNHFFTSSR